MASNSFGQLFRITTFGESHGPAIGVIIDGCPAGLEIDLEALQQALDRRRPGSHSLVSPRNEKDHVEVLSGLFEGCSTGAPIALLIRNRDADSSKYAPIKHLYRPGHANFTYLEKYGIFDDRGGGRASARETACRVAAGALAQQFLATEGIECVAYLASMGSCQVEEVAIEGLRQQVDKSLLFCPCSQTEQKMKAYLEQLKLEGDSTGGIVSFVATGLAVGMGDPVYDKLEAQLASAFMSIPASKAFEIGEGFAAAKMRGSEHNDAFILKEGKASLDTNHSGGTLGGISTGMPLFCRVAFKPTSSIRKEQRSVSIKGENALFVLPEGSRHDPCVAIRAVPVVEAMGALVLADALLKNRLCRIKKEGAKAPSAKGNTNSLSF